MSSHQKAFEPHEKHPQFRHLPLSSAGPQDCALCGSALLNTPYFNKGAAFTTEERRNFKLTGLLPQNIQTLEQQVKRAYQQYSTRKDDLAKNTFMTSLAEQNQVLYFRVSRSFCRLFYLLLSCFSFSYCQQNVGFEMEDKCVLSRDKLHYVVLHWGTNCSCRNVYIGSICTIDLRNFSIYYTIMLFLTQYS
jgi:malate dehydrogenase (oxaloacetate-decarboxylating)